MPHDNGVSGMLRNGSERFGPVLQHDFRNSSERFRTI